MPPAGHRVDEPAAELFHPQRVAERVDHRARRDAVGRHLPQLLDADGVLLGLAALGQRQARQQLLGQVAADAVAEDRDLRVDVDAGLERAAPLAVAADTTVAGPHADDAVAVKEHLDARKAREQVDAGSFHALGQPLAEAADRDDQVAVIAQRRRRERQRDLAAGVEQVDAVVRGRRPRWARPARGSRGSAPGGSTDRARRRTAGARRPRAPSRAPRSPAARRPAPAGAATAAAPPTVLPDRRQR